MIKPLLYGLLVLLLGIAIVGHYLYQKEPARAEGQDAAFRLTAAELLEAFQQNEAAANDNYLGKWLEIRGVINLLNPEEGMVYLGEPGSSHLSELFTGLGIEVVTCITKSWRYCFN